MNKVAVFLGTLLFFRTSKIYIDHLYEKLPKETEPYHMILDEKSGISYGSCNIIQNRLSNIVHGDCLTSSESLHNQIIPGDFSK